MTRADDLIYLSRNFQIVATLYGLSVAARQMAWQSALLDSRKAARIYAAIVRSL